MKLAAISLLAAAICSAWDVNIFEKNGLRFVYSGAGGSYDLVLESDGTEILSGQLGIALPNTSFTATATCDPCDFDICYEWGDLARLYLKSPSGSDNCGRVAWISSFGRKLEDCFNLVPGVHWYGGGVQTWPIEKKARFEAPLVVGGNFEGVVETYWLTSSGVAIHVDEDTPLFTSWNTSHQGQVCFSAQDRYPYTTRSEVQLKYDFCIPGAEESMKDVHIRSLRRYYETPKELPDLDMLRYPFWSTWAQYKDAVNQSVVLEMARRIVQEGYRTNSHIEIDDNWETCYGEAEFNPEKFPDPAGMIQELAELGITRITLWAHPFINYDCPSFETAFKNSYFITDTKSKPTVTSWWQGKTAGLIDWSNEEAVCWWRARLEKLQLDYNITSFKFDGGEATWLPASYQCLTGESDLLPNILTTKYIDAVTSFGGMVETRAAHRNQGRTFFIRMYDKDSRWTDDNGLQSLIPSLLLFSILGYSFILPDMVGGNEYCNETASDELYIRWAQANVFMPAWQFSVLPWDVDPTGMRDRLVKAAVDLRIAYADELVAAAQQTLDLGYPMNRPMWWVDPTDPETFTIDDQFMLGENILVAPVVQEGASSRDIYLPKGNWQIATASGPQNFTGPLWLRDWPAPIDVLPFFGRILKERKLNE